MDVATNRFVPDGVRRAASTNPVEPGDSGIGALFNLVRDSVELLRRHRVDHTRTGRLVYILLNGAEPKHERIVRAVIDLAHQLRLDVCATNVPDAALAERLGALNCDYAQGSYKGPAVAADRFVERYGYDFG